MQLDVLGQRNFGLRFDWGPDGLAALAPGSDVIVIVDVLRFTTCVDVAVARGAVVLPYPWARSEAKEFAAARVTSSASGQELVSRGWGDDVEMASAHDVSSSVPHLVDDVFIAMAPPDRPQRAARRVRWTGCPRGVGTVGA